MACWKSLSEKIAETDRKLNELKLNLKEFEDFLDLTRENQEEIKNFAENSKNYDRETWESLKQDEKEVEERILFEFENIQNPKKTQEVLSERGKVQPHWLFVK